MKVTFRFLIPLFIVIGCVLLFGERQLSFLLEKWFARDLDTRSTLIAHFIQDELKASLREKNRNPNQILALTAQKERMHSIGMCSLHGKILYRSQGFPPDLDCFELSKITEETFLTRKLSPGSMHIGGFPIYENGKIRAVIVTVLDMGYVESRSRLIEKYIIFGFLGLIVLITITMTWMARMSWRDWIAHTRTLVRSFRGLIENPKQLRRMGAYNPIVRDLKKLVQDAEARRISRDESIQTWNASVLKNILREELEDQQIMVVSNREPFIHIKTEGGIKLQRPASGLVTALEPVMEACSGVWIAHGSGSGDKDMVDKSQKVTVPPDDPRYSLRRVWLSPEEERGYYYGFANEGLWPLCHIAHTRPIFRSQDYDYYKVVNEKFAQAIFDEAKSNDPIILIQDYHFALLPRLIRNRLPKAIIVMFWHIPWPNPEVFGICPWRESLIDGLLGSSILGFHTQFHCNNFFETVDRFVECRIDREDSAVSYMGELSWVKPYPISIEWPPKWLKGQEPAAPTRDQVYKQLDLGPEIKLGVGVDRLDYTKGIKERLLAVETLLKTHPEWVGKFVFLQIAAPSRTEISSYSDLRKEVTRLAESINEKYSTPQYMPIILEIKHFEPPEVYRYYKAADLCIVSSLHDGMNLVAKEFVASRDDEEGVLILSSFAGASRELQEALIINPYNIDQAAESLLAALTMPRREQKERMKSLRARISENNVYRWAGRILLDAASVKKRNKFQAWTKRRKRLEGVFSPS